MEPSPVDVLGGFHYFVVRLLGIVPESGVEEEYLKAKIIVLAPSVDIECNNNYVYAN